MEHVGTTLKQARIAQKIPLRRMANDVKISYNTINSIERGHIKRPNPYTIEQLAGYLGLSDENLMIPCRYMPEYIFLALERRPAMQVDLMKWAKMVNAEYEKANNPE